MATPQEKAFTAYGKTFHNEKDMHMYGKMMKERRARTKARKASMSEQEKQDAQTRAHFAKEAKHFGL